MIKRYLCLLLAACIPLAASAVASASAGPGWEASVHSVPTSLAPGANGYVNVRVFNLGAKASVEGATITETLPTGISGLPSEGWTCSGATPDVCTYTLPSIPAAVEEEHVLEVKVAAGTPEGKVTNKVEVTGGGAPADTAVTSTLTVSSTPATFGFAGTDAFFANADGTVDSQAGSHPYEATVSFILNNNEDFYNSYGFPGLPAPAEELRNLTVDLPPGVIGNPTAAAHCTRQQFDQEACPPASQVGTTRAGITSGAVSVFTIFLPVYNLDPPPGVPARFGFTAVGTHALIDAAVRSGGDYGLTIHVRNIPQRLIFLSSVTLWGVPSDPSHDALRSGFNCPEGCSTGAPPTPFLTMPAVCTAPQSFSLSGTSWGDASAVASDSFVMHDLGGAPLGLSGCGRLGFEPSISLAPDTTRASSPAGLSFDLRVPQEGLASSQALATANVRDVSVLLPEGLSINPGRASGLLACSAAQSAIGTEAAPSCPAASRIGRAVVSTPLLPDKLEGGVYVLQSNPPDVKLLLAASGDGVNVKLAGDAVLDEATGRVATTFKDAPQLPFSDFKLSFDGGPRGALSMPASCGTYTTSSDLTPWDTPFTADASPSSSFIIDQGVGGGACSSGGGFGPGFVAGTTSNQAGGFSPLSVTFSRSDGEQELGAVQVKTPPGLLGVLKSVPLCAEPQASAGACGQESLIGHTTVAAGPGPDPLYVQGGQAYLTGPYKGTPFGLSIVVPAVAGPFNLGNVVVRASIAVDPSTAALTITSDPLPTILKGVPLQIRMINVTVDREGFVFNPTSCDPQTLGGTLTSTQGAQAAVSSRFQAAGCAALGFAPRFSASAPAKVSRAGGAALDVKIGYPIGSFANIHTAAVTLPKQLPARLSTVQQACPAVTFEANPASCDEGSVVGTATASTPILANPLTGPAYLVSHGGEAFPDIVLVLQGQGITIDLVGNVFINKTGVTSATFAHVPDAPISSFELSLPEGPHSALAAVGSLCAGALNMPTKITAQNGAQFKQTTKIKVTGCPKAKKKAKHRHKKGKAKRRKRGKK